MGDWAQHTVIAELLEKMRLLRRTLRMRLAMTEG